MQTWNNQRKWPYHPYTLRELIVSPLDYTFIDNNFKALKISISKDCTKLVSSMILPFVSVIGHYRNRGHFASDI